MSEVSHSDILVAVTRLDTKVDMHTNILKDQETRLRSLERFRYHLAGFAMAGSVVGSAVVQLLFRLVGK